mmetsp:Transcript_90687/g.171021  ORF Transcript_90687/g.171021 Transcript_90687/m.171021 type:complete len:82 (+) Transcript_90687:3643-3888(+)
MTSPFKNAFGRTMRLADLCTAFRSAASSVNERREGHGLHVDNGGASMGLKMQTRCQVILRAARGCSLCTTLSLIAKPQHIG